MTDPQKNVKISIVVDDGETTTVKTFYRAREISYSMENPNLVILNGTRLYDMSFKVERDQEKDCVSTTECFGSDDGELYLRRGGIIRKLGL